MKGCHAIIDSLCGLQAAKPRRWQISASNHYGMDDDDHNWWLHGYFPFSDTAYFDALVEKRAQPLIRRVYHQAYGSEYQFSVNTFNYDKAYVATECHRGKYSDRKCSPELDADVFAAFKRFLVTVPVPVPAISQCVSCRASPADSTMVCGHTIHCKPCSRAGLILSASSWTYV